MNPHHSSNQNPACTSAVQQVNRVIDQQMLNGSNVGGLFPNNMPVAAPPCFMNFPSQPFPLQNPTGQFPNVIGGFNPQQNLNPFAVNQFNPAQLQQGQFLAQTSMNLTAYRQCVGLSGEQVLVQNTIQNICQLLQLQNPNYAQRPPGNLPMFQNQIVNVMNPQYPGFPVNQQFGMYSTNGPMQHANHGPQNMGQQLQRCVPGASGSVQTQQPQNLHATLTNFQNQIPQGVGPQNLNLITNQMLGVANLNDPMQNDDQGPPGFVLPMMDVNSSRQIVNMGQTHNPSPPFKNFEGNQKNVPTSGNGGRAESQHKNFIGHKTYDASHKGFKSHKHVEEKFGMHKGNDRKDGDNNLTVGIASQNSTSFEKKVPLLNYTEQEIKEWREARKKNYPTKGTILKKHKKAQTLSDVTNQDAMLRRQQLKEILAKQAKLGCEVADVPPSYLFGPDKQNPTEKKNERQQYKKGKFHNKRGTPFQDFDRSTKRARPRDQDSFKTNRQTKPNKREPSLLQKLLTRDIKRDKTHLLQVLRFMTANSFLTRDSLRFPSVIVRETNVHVPCQETTCSVFKVEEEEEGEIID